MTSPSSKICAVVTEPTIEAARSAIRQAASCASIIELRLDYLRDFDFSNPAALAPLLEDKPLPIILTCRAVEEGGQQKVEDPDRLRMLVEGGSHFADYSDIEAAHYHAALEYNPDIARLIVSYHNFEETPVDLNAIYERITSLPAAVHKIVTWSRSESDSLAILKLQDRAATEHRDSIILAMGEPGRFTRITGPARGGFLTYGSLAQGAESAPGQFTCDQLARIYRVGALNHETGIIGIIGRPVSHSASPVIHNAAFAEQGLNHVYLPFEVTDPALFYKRFVHPKTREVNWDIRGLSVTIPHKMAMLSLVDRLDPVAAAVGAVNTLVVEDGAVGGFNTDVAGFVAPLAAAFDLRGRPVAVIGAGGAARAAVVGLLNARANVSIFARDPSHATDISARFGVPVLSLNALRASDAQIIVNATPVGMRGHSEGKSPIPAEAFAGKTLAYDLVYNPLRTRFLRDAEAHGCQTLSGIKMLIHQASLQYELWTGRSAPIGIMESAALAAAGLSGSGDQDSL